MPFLHITVNDSSCLDPRTVESRGGGFPSKSKDQSHAIAHSPGSTMPSADTPPMPDARRNVTVGTEGEYERSKHGQLYGRGNPTPPIRRGASSDRAAAGIAAPVVCHAPAVTQKWPLVRFQIAGYFGNIVSIAR